VSPSLPLPRQRHHTHIIGRDRVKVTKNKKVKKGLRTCELRVLPKKEKPKPSLILLMEASVDGSLIIIKLQSLYQQVII